MSVIGGIAVAALTTARTFLRLAGVQLGRNPPRRVQPRPHQA
jgi:hypothetical protein